MNSNPSYILSVLSFFPILYLYLYSKLSSINEGTIFDKFTKSR